jgi:hypothetical protein
MSTSEALPQTVQHVQGQVTPYGLKVHSAFRLLREALALRPETPLRDGGDRLS